MIYVASPYKHADESVMQNRYESVCKFTASGLNMGFIFYSPIVHCHQLRKAGFLSNEWKKEGWAVYDISILRLCDSMYICGLPGWKESKGLDLEQKICRTLGIPMILYTPRDPLAPPMHKVFTLQTESWRGSVPDII
jgi:hypothetical protein